jgi:glycine cleavage system aminomethyltransferase T/glycine/D-amino acid oxidase-like deaminating enzyme
MNAALPGHARIVIIGGGIIGASTLYHLAKAGVQDCVLLERDRFASGTTWHAAGLTTRIRDSRGQSQLVQYTCDLFQSLETETGQATGYRENGALYIATNPMRHELLKRQASASKHMGVRVDPLTAGEVQERWPLLNVEDVLGGVFIHGNGQVNPLDAAMALIKGARQGGGLAFEHTAVEDVLVRDRRVIGVRTARGDIACERVLLAGGLWSHRFAKRLGVALPLHGAEHYYIVTEPMRGLARTTPVLGNPDERAYYKEDAGKLLVGFFEADAKPWPPMGEEIPSQFSFSDLPADLEHIEPQLNLAFRRVPALQDVGIKLFFCGPESFTNDSRAYMGPTAEVRGLYVATGFNSYGILSSGGAGKVMAAWLIDGIPPLAMTSVHAQRAMAFQANSRYMQDRVVEALGFNMSLHWPGHQLRTARNIRHSPLHDRLIAAGAIMGERSGWEIPLYYDAPGATLPQTPSLAYQAWFPRLAEECVAARDRAALVDQSCYGKFLVSGPDAVAALNHLSANEMDVQVGRSVYTHWLNVRGGIEADVVVVRQSEQQFLVVTGPGGQVRDRCWFEANVPSGCNVQIHDVTAQYGMFSVNGPASRGILEALSDADLSNDALPFGHAQLIDIGYGRAWVLRRSYMGELGYELFPTTDLCRHVYDVLCEEGQPRGLVNAGFFALLHSRLEKGFVHYGADIGEDDTPLEAGLRFAVAFDKPGGFIGRDALVSQRDAGPLASRIANLRVRQATQSLGPYLYRNEPVWKGGEIVGYVTSGAWGFRLDGSFGIASVRRTGGVTAAWLAEGDFEVEVAGVRYAADLQFPGFYDPKGERLRG